MLYEDIDVSRSLFRAFRLDRRHRCVSGGGLGCADDEDRYEHGRRWRLLCVCASYAHGRLVHDAVRNLPKPGEDSNERRESLRPICIMRAAARDMPQLRVPAELLASELTLALRRS